MKRIIKHTTFTILLSIAFGVASVNAAEKTIDVFALNNDKTQQGIGEKIGTLHLQDSAKGLIITPNLTALSQGKHGFHFHEKASCEGGEKDGQYLAGMAAGGHFDPLQTGKHLGPKGHGHLGDLPVLEVNAQGEAKDKVLAPHLKLAKIEGHAIVIHQGGDNYSDNPPLGGGGDRIACGVVK